MIEILKNYLIIIPIIFLIITIILIIRIIKLKKNYLEGNGTIIDFYENSCETFLNEYEHKTISPIISYEVNEKKYTFKGNYCEQSMKKGDKVKILYKRDDVSKALVAKGSYFALTITSIFTIISFIATILVKMFY